MQIITKGDKRTVRVTKTERAAIQSTIDIVSSLSLVSPELDDMWQELCRVQRSIDSEGQYDLVDKEDMT